MAIEATVNTKNGGWLIWRPDASQPYRDCVLDLTVDCRLYRLFPNKPQRFEQKLFMKLRMNARGTVNRLDDKGTIPSRVYDPVEGVWTKDGHEIVPFGENSPARQFFHPMTDEQYTQWLLKNADSVEPENQAPPGKKASTKA